MKMYNVYGLFYLLLLLTATSCLGDGGQTISLGSYPGVVVKRNDSAKIYLKGHDVIYSPQTNTSVDDGDCVIIDFTLDYGKPENSDSGRVKGYLTVDISRITPVSYQAAGSLVTDTSAVLPNEHTLSAIQQRNALILDRFFLYTEHRSDNTSPLHFDLSYDPEQTVTDKTYDLFLRVTKDMEASPAAQQQVQCNAFDLSELSKRETDSLIFRIHYVQGFNKDSTQINWSFTPAYRFAL
ncbi:MAG: hypothetical protein LBD89_09760 [Tannerellaceae bacterium]|jgi:hypothetical protein|nr:hypothetical protein [Tannerellaceae bacterium]